MNLLTNFLTFLFPLLLILIILLIGFIFYRFWPNSTHKKIAAILAMIILPLALVQVYAIGNPPDEGKHIWDDLYQDIGQLSQSDDRTKNEILLRYQLLSEDEAKGIHQILLVDLFDYPTAKDINKIIFNRSWELYDLPFNKITSDQRERIIKEMTDLYTPLLNDSSISHLPHILKGDDYISNRYQKEIEEGGSPLNLALNIKKLISL